MAHIGLDTEALLLTDLDARVQGVPCRLTFTPVTVLRNTLPEAAPSKRSGEQAGGGCGSGHLLVRLKGERAIERVGEHGLELCPHELMSWACESWACVGCGRRHIPSAASTARPFAPHPSP